MLLADAPTEFMEAYERYVKTAIAPTKKQIDEIFSNWKDVLYWAGHGEKQRMPAPSPIQRSHTRIKRPESILDKISRQPKNYPDGIVPTALANMPDILGARIVVYFLTSLPLIDHEIRNTEHFTISTEHPPVLYIKEGAAPPTGLELINKVPKQSGYTSVHYILQLKDSTVPPDQRPWFELQVRTIVEDCWAEVEHLLGYKPQRRTSFAVRKQFQILSTLLQRRLPGSS